MRIASRSSLSDIYISHLLSTARLKNVHVLLHTDIVSYYTSSTAQKPGMASAYPYTNPGLDQGLDAYLPEIQQYIMYN